MPRTKRTERDPKSGYANAYEIPRPKVVQEAADRALAADLANSISDSPSKLSDNGSDHDPKSISSKKSSKTKKKKKKKKSKKRKKRAIVVESSDSSDSSHPSESSVSESDSSSDDSFDISFLEAQLQLAKARKKKLASKSKK